MIRARSVYLACLLSSIASAQHVWQFAVSGDSRNCGDVVMPAIAQGVIADKSSFYWHLGDFRRLSAPDQDYLQQHPGAELPVYAATAWKDFIDRQLLPFGNLPVYLSLGNHELYASKTREQIVATFADWLAAPIIRQQRLSDDPADHVVRTYYHWVQDGIDFVNLDNASPDQFDAAQLAWIQRTLAKAKADSDIRAVVVGMHEALPQSIGVDHSMSESEQGAASGTAVYRQLLDLRKTKPVYVLASHSHFYLENVFNTEYWRTHGGVLPGWIVGTAGAERYRLPDGVRPSAHAREHIYGYLLATVNSTRRDPVRFTFKQLKRTDIPANVENAFTKAFVDVCWNANP